jgi:DNA-binding response OmpR family regulator
MKEVALISVAPVILLVDDHEDTVDMYALALLGMGFKPVTATNVDGAFHRACMYHPRVVVTDLSMAVRAGFDLIHRMRADTRTAGIPVIVLTGLTLASVRQQAREAGCDRFLVKPCAADALAAEIRDVLLTADEDDDVAL